MKNNPFTSKTFVSIWTKHFTNSTQPIHFNSIENLSFIKSRSFPIFLNVGKNWTKAMSYSVNPESKDYPKKKILLIYDIPNYIIPNKLTDNTPLNTLKVSQYEGFLANLSEFKTLDQYMQDRFDSKSRYRFNRNKKRLYSCFNINESIYFGSILKEEYDTILKSFRILLEKTFLEKQVNTNILEKWDYYCELVYPMILEKKASLYVLRNEEEPICIALNFHSDDLAFLFFSVYDNDYSKFGIGYMSVMKCIDWCIENNFKGYDFSKGYFLYKERWSNVVYKFDYHILYDSKNLISSSLAYVIANYFRLKQQLREKNINKIFNKMMFFIKIRKKAADKQSSFEFGPEEEINPAYSLNKLNIQDAAYLFLKRPMYEFIYKTGEHVKVVSVTESEGTYWAIGSKYMQRILIKNA